MTCASSLSSLVPTALFLQAGATAVDHLEERGGFEYVDRLRDRRLHEGLFRGSRRRGFLLVGLLRVHAVSPRYSRSGEGVDVQADLDVRRTDVAGSASMVKIRI